MQKKFSIYMDEDLKLIMEGIAKAEDRSLTKTISRACREYADRVTGKGYDPFIIPVVEKKKKVEKEIEGPADDVSDLDF